MTTLPSPPRSDPPSQLRSCPSLGAARLLRLRDRWCRRSRGLERQRHRRQRLADYGLTVLVANQDVGTGR
jgi:hypothetical protein